MSGHEVIAQRFNSQEALQACVHVTEESVVVETYDAVLKLGNFGLGLHRMVVTCLRGLGEARILRNRVIWCLLVIQVVDDDGGTSTVQ